MPKGYGYGKLNPKRKSKKKSVLAAVDNGHF